MLKSQRQREILDMLKKDNFVTVTALAERLYASLPTIRRDLSLLEDEGHIKRCHGGAMLLVGEENTPIHYRRETNAREKAAMCRAAVSLIGDRDVIFVDSSSTALRISDYLDSVKGVTVITNGHLAAEHFLEKNLLTYSTGGRLLKESLVYAGYAAERAIMGYNADTVFFSAASLSLDGTISDWSDEEHSMRAVMHAHAKRSVFMCDHTKIGKSSAFALLSLGEVDYLVSDKPVPREILEKFPFSLVSNTHAYLYKNTERE